MFFKTRHLMWWGCCRSHPPSHCASAPKAAALHTDWGCDSLHQGDSESPGSHGPETFPQYLVFGWTKNTTPQIPSPTLSLLSVTSKAFLWAKRELGNFFPLIAIWWSLNCWRSTCDFNWAFLLKFSRFPGWWDTEVQKNTLYIKLSLSKLEEFHSECVGKGTGEGKKLVSFPGVLYTLPPLMESMELCFGCLEAAYLKFVLRF